MSDWYRGRYRPPKRSGGDTEGILGVLVYGTMIMIVIYALPVILIVLLIKWIVDSTRK